ncbi:hypothetical protein ACFLRG_03790 [Bacteroidota bacterium]
MRIEQYKIVEYPLLQYIIRIVLFFWIIFASLKFSVNPSFFGITIIIALIIILTISERTIETKQHFIEIRHKKWLSFLSKKEKIGYNEIVDIQYVAPEMSGMAIVLNLIEYIPGTIQKGPKLSFTLKRNRWKKIPTIGGKEKNDELIKAIKKNLQNIN